MGSRQHSALAAGDILLHISRLRIFYINYDICAHHAAPARPPASGGSGVT